jgi:hypothetical protein
VPPASSSVFSWSSGGGSSSSGGLSGVEVTDEAVLVAHLVEAQLAGLVRG